MVENFNLFTSNLMMGKLTVLLLLLVIGMEAECIMFMMCSNINYLLYLQPFLHIQAFLHMHDCLYCAFTEWVLVESAASGYICNLFAVALILLSSSVTLPRTAAIPADSIIVYTNTNICSLIVLH